jgi:two-component system CheB/CheR fusion protein
MTDPPSDRSEEALPAQFNIISGSGDHSRLVVGLGGSAGSMGALKSFFEHMPPDTGLAFAMVMDLSPEHESALAERLRGCTRMEVVQVSGALKIEPGTVYVIPPGSSMRMRGGTIEVEPITERKQAEEMRLWLSVAVMASSDAVLSFSLDGTILSWNQGAERIFGHTASEAIGRHVSMLAPAGRQKAEQDMLLSKIASAEPVENFESVRRRKDGTELHVSITNFPIRGDSGQVMGGTAIVRDISASKRSEEALRQSEERLRLIIENATEFAIFTLDLDRCVTTWNSGAERLLGYTNDEILGKTVDIIFTPEDRAQRAPERETQTALAEGRASDDRYHVRKDGSRFWASGAAMVMRNPQGAAIGFVKILRDQTAARESREALQAADAAKDRFLAVLSHELRNPLASIDSAASLICADGVSPADAKEASAIVARQTRTMKVLLNDLLDVSRLKLGRLELERGPVQLSSVVSSALETTRPLLQEAGHSLTVDLPHDDVQVDGDALRLGQVVSNLLTNAIRYTPRGGKIMLRAQLEGGSLVLSVKDNGIGMDPRRIADMFEMFTQGDTNADTTHGLGIGLALVKSIVERHGGEVTAHSAGRGKGSDFRVRLPNARLMGPKAAAPASTPAPTTAKMKRRGLVLVADDNVDAGWGIAKLLEIAGFETLHVRSGEEALEAMQQRKPDAAVVDIGMPDVDGHEVARRARAAPWGRQMALIAATGWGQETDEQQAKAAGFDMHMTKPVDLRKLAKSLDEMIGARRK